MISGFFVIAVSETYRPRLGVAGSSHAGSGITLLNLNKIKLLFCRVIFVAPGCPHFAGREKEYRGGFDSRTYRVVF